MDTLCCRLCLSNISHLTFHIALLTISPALMCMEDLGALIFFVDPLSAHPHQADIDSLIRLANCGNVIVCPNPTSAMSMMHTLKCALQKGSRGMVSNVSRYSRIENVD